MIEALPPHTTSDGFCHALAEMRAVVGAAHAQADDTTRAYWSRSTLPQETIPAAVVRPACTAEVQEIVRIAGRRGLALHPISCGKNWGYSDACAARSGQIILDLRRMNRILEVNEELAYATIEPGVTQGQMVAFLAERGLGLWVDATGAGPDASIVGNTLERGFGHSVNGDRFLNSCGLEVVLADGRLLRTGFGHYGNAQAAAVYKWGVGPYLDGLFTQSNLGIVTRLTFWLIPRPPCFRAFVISVREPDDIGDIADALRQLRLAGTVRTPVHLFNAQRLIAGIEHFPWTEHDGTTALTAEELAQLRCKHGIPAWLGTGSLSGTTEEVAAAACALRRALRGIASLHFIDDWRMQLMERLGDWLAALGFPRLRERAAKLRVLYDLLQGKPSAECLKGTLWRVRPSGRPMRSADPLDHNAGLLWLSPVLPMTRAHVQRVTALAEPLFASFGFEYQVTFSAVSARALCAVMSIAYNKADAAETKRARACYQQLLKELITAGYAPYRMGTLSVPELATGSEVFWDVAAELKAALDPFGIFSPGHYEPLAQNRFCLRQAKPGKGEGDVRSSAETFHRNPVGSQSHPVEPSQQPEASLAWRPGDRRYEA